MNTELFYQYNPWWEDPSFNPTDILFREALMTQMKTLLADKAVVFLTGLRRVGKTTAMKMTIRHLLHEQGIPPNCIFYLSMDDYLLREYSIVELVETYRTLQRLSVDEKIYLFFDEITFKEDFRLQLKNLYDKGHCKIFASSSSSSVLRDSRGYLTGRERVVEVMPLTFDEYLIFKGIQLKKRDEGLKASYFEDYLHTGGMPEYVKTNDRNYLTALVDDILYKDIIAFHGIKNPAIIKDYFVLLMERAGKQISLNKIANVLKIAPDTARRYFDMFLETYLIYQVPRYGKTNEKLLSPKKIYAADIGIRNLVTGFRDKGALFENLVFLAIKKRNPHYLYEEGSEIDFITDDNVLIEVKYGQEMTNHQQLLFDSFNARKKLTIQSWRDFALLSED